MRLERKEWAVLKGTAMTSVMNEVGVDGEDTREKESVKGAKAGLCAAAPAHLRLPPYYCEYLPRTYVLLLGVHFFTLPPTSHEDLLLPGDMPE